MSVAYVNRTTPIQGYEIEIDLWDIESIKSIPNRDINKDNVQSIRSQLDSFEDIRKLPPLHVAPMGSFNVGSGEYPLINGFHRIAAYRDLWYRYCRDNDLDYDNPADAEKIPDIKIPVIVRTDIVSREDVINARYLDNVSHGSPPTTKEKREYALFLAETYKGELSQAEIARRCGLDKSTVGKLLKRVGRPENEDRESDRDGFSVLLENHTLPLLKAAEKYFHKEKSIFGLFGLKPEKDQEKRVKLLMDTMREKDFTPGEIVRIQSIAIAMYQATKNLLPE